MSIKLIDFVMNIIFFPTSPSETLLTSKGPSRPASNEVYHLQIGIHQQKNGCHQKKIGLEQQQEVALLRKAWI